MEEKKYIMTLDEGTTSLRTLIVDKEGKIVSIAQKEFTQIFPQSGWVEHDANEIWGSQVSTIQEAKRKARIKSHHIAGLGITNQRETIVVWNKRTGLPVYNAIVWQDTRTSKFCEELKAKGHEKLFHEKTGLVINPYFSGTKLRWILKNVEGAKKALENHELLAGTIDTWLIWKLTNGKVHATDVSNASRTLLFNIKEQKWDEDILKIMDIPREILPEVKPSSYIYGDVEPEVFSKDAKGVVPIAGVIGDQQGALFGQLALNVGEVKNTYGTGNFTLVNTGKDLVYSKNNLLTTIAWKINEEETVYALEGSVFVTGAALQWLRDGIRIIYDSTLSDTFANMVSKKDDQKIYFVPALTGLGAPYWDSSARGSIFGIERGTKREHLIKATLEAIAYQTNDLITTMSKDINKKIETVKVDGGASNSNFLMQFQADISDVEIIRPKNTETTAMGAAFLAGLATKYWSSIEELKKINQVDKTFKPEISSEDVKEKLEGWKDAVSRSRNWIK